jgi:hypothetical protein
MPEIVENNRLCHGRLSRRSGHPTSCNSKLLPYGSITGDPTQSPIDDLRTISWAKASVGDRLAAGIKEALKRAGSWAIRYYWLRR